MSNASNLRIIKKRLDRLQWEEECEIDLYHYCHSEYLLNLLRDYSLDYKVKIKARKGLIQIERIK